MKLNQSNLHQLDDRISVPRYNREDVRGGILHIGVGNFHRSHQAVYTNDLLQKGLDTDWGIRGAGVRQTDSIMRDFLEEQDWLNCVVESDADGMDVSVVGAMIDFLPVADGHSPIIDSISNPETKIVSLTVTEGGYFLDAHGEFDPGHGDIRYDITNLQSPRTVFGAIVAGIARRRALSGTPITVMSCDNLPGNGKVAKDAVMGLARESDAELAKWIADNVTFPNGMVDRITPATSDRERQILQENFGLVDASPVFCEPFRQWVLEDNFANGRPEFEAAGVTMTSSVHDYENMKIRVLNGGHAIIAYSAGLAGIEYVHDAMNQPEIEAFLKKVIHDDVAPNVAPVGGQTPLTYLDQSIARFKNPSVADTISRLCLDGSNRQPKFIIPAIRDQLAKGIVPKGLALCSAMWCHYCSGEGDGGDIATAGDPNWDALHTAAIRAKETPSEWLQQHDIYGDLISSELFCEAFSHAHAKVRNYGSIGAIRNYLTSS